MRILKLCKRLDKFTIDDILMIACNIDESVLKLQLIKFVQDKRLVQRGDLYFYKKRTPQKNNSTNIYQNILNRQFRQNKSDKAYSTDITYLTTKTGRYYLSVVKDLGSKNFRFFS